jgi:hypothetical protein
MALARMASLPQFVKAEKASKLSRMNTVDHASTAQRGFTLKAVLVGFSADVAFKEDI